MTVYLCIPRPAMPVPGSDRVIASKPEQALRIKCRWTTQDPRSSYGLGVILVHGGDVLDGVTFARLRDVAGAWLEAEDMERVGRALGLSPGERLGRA